MTQFDLFPVNISFICPQIISQNQRYPYVLQISDTFCGILEFYKFQKFMSVDVNDKRKLQIMSNTITYQQIA